MVQLSVNVAAQNFDFPGSKDISRLCSVDAQFQNHNNIVTATVFV
jgi:hypothetical protein